MRKYKKGRKINLKRISILFIIIILILLLILIKIPNKKTEVKSLEKKDTKEEYKLSLVMVGDALIHDRLYNDAYKDGGYDFKPYLKLIKDKIKNYDLAYYNQETILGGTSIGLSSYPSFNSPQELGDDMIDTGFNLVR